jgi:SAM-dependent methyltransferase
MGLPRAAIQLIAETVHDYKIGGRVLIIGKQDVWGTGLEATRWIRERGITPASCEVRISTKPDFKRLDFIQDISLFNLMGFREVITLDHSDYEGAQILCDLNLPLPDELVAKAGCFDLIVESGCMEHIFNVPQVLRNLHRLAGDGGVVIHLAASSNLVDHGFYMFSPGLFADYYTANRWQILQHYFFQNGPNFNAPWKIYEYKPGGLWAYSFAGGLNRKMCGVYVAARKLPGSTCDASVQQGMFSRTWTRGTADPATGSAGRWQAFRERLKPHVPRFLIPALLAIEARMKTLGGVRRYLQRHRPGR